MVNQQLVDYLKAQFAAGIRKETARGDLITAGWSADDVDDSIKGAEAVPAATPVAQARTSTISVSDLISGSKLEAVPLAMDSKVNNKKPKSSSLPSVVSATVEPQTNGSTPLTIKEASASAPRRSLIIIIVLAALGLGFAGTSVFFYMQNRGLNDKLTAAGGAGDAANAQVASLTAQIAELTKARDEAKTQLESLTSANQNLAATLSFFVVAPGLSLTEELPTTLKGTLGGGGKNPYTLTAENGIQVTIKNFKDEKVAAVLKPLIGSAVEISGTHPNGSKEITVTHINGTAL